MSHIYPTVDPEGLLEFSVVYTDRSLNHMSQHFQSVMKDLNALLSSVYNADSVVIVPGGGSYAMESVARQFAKNKRCLVLRNGFFSFRWSQILEKAGLSNEVTVVLAQAEGDEATAAYSPAPIEEVEQHIREQKPEVVFAPHVETASGIILPDDYVQRMAKATHDVDGVFVLDCVASGAIWVDMKALDVDVLISAPQKGWSSTPCAGLVMMNTRAEKIARESESDSFACDLNKWLEIMDAYLSGGHAYHATMPTDGLTKLRDTIVEMEREGLALFKQAQWALGQGARELFTSFSYQSVAANGFGAPGVIVNYAPVPPLALVKACAQKGLQIAAGVPLMCDEPEGFQTFRIGLFGIDKLRNVDRTLESLKSAFVDV